VVFSDATLVAIADGHPRDRPGLARISGVGPAKLERYGEVVLAVLGGADPQQVDVFEVNSN
jgi:DNA helicase-2/ATP-dependent DNA helicase PcrA